MPGRPTWGGRDGRRQRRQQRGRLGAAIPSGYAGGTRQASAGARRDRARPWARERATRGKVTGGEVPLCLLDVALRPRGAPCGPVNRAVPASRQGGSTASSASRHFPDDWYGAKSAKCQPIAHRRRSTLPLVAHSLAQGRLAVVCWVGRAGWPLPHDPPSAVWMSRSSPRPS